MNIQIKTGCNIYVVARESVMIHEPQSLFINPPVNPHMRFKYTANNNSTDILGTFSLYMDETTVEYIVKYLRGYHVDWLNLDDELLNNILIDAMSLDMANLIQLLTPYRRSLLPVLSDVEFAPRAEEHATYARLITTLANTLFGVNINP